MLVGVASLTIIPALRNIGILLHKQANQIKHFCPECMAVSKRPINQFEPFRKSRQQVIRAYCPNIYTVSSALFWLSSFISVATLSLGVSTLVCSYLAAAVDALTQKSHP